MTNEPKPQGHHIRILLNVAIEIEVEQRANPLGVKERESSSESPPVHKVARDMLGIVTVDILNLFDELQEWLDSAFVKLFLVHARSVEAAKLVKDLLVVGRLGVRSGFDVPLQETFDDLSVFISKEGKVPNGTLVGWDGMVLQPTSVWGTEQVSYLEIWK